MRSAAARLGPVEGSQALGEDDASHSGACRASYDRAERGPGAERIRAGYREERVMALNEALRASSGSPLRPSEPLVHQRI